MSILKNSAGAKITNSNIARNIQVGGDAMIDNQGEIESSKIEHNLHIQHLIELPPDENLRRLKAIGRWLKDHVLAAIIIFVITTILGIYITKWLALPQDHSRPSVSAPKAMPV